MSPPSASLDDTGDRWSGSSILLLLFGVILIGIGLYFLVLRPPLLPEDLRYLGISQAQVQTTVPHLTAWLTHVFLVLGGYISATGILMMALAATAYRAHRPGAGITAAAAGAASIGLMTAVNFSIQSDFKWLLLGFAMVWACSIALFFLEASRSRNAPPAYGALPAAGQRYERHYAESLTVDAAAADIFAFADDFSRLSLHMSQSSGMMMGGRMELALDDRRGRIVGSRVRMSGVMIGISLFLEEVVTEREPPRRKAWETVGNPKLLVIGHYRMGFDITANGRLSDLRIFIDYDLPSSPWLRGLGYLFAPIYARWCVRQMLNSVRNGFVGLPPGR